MAETPNTGAAPAAEAQVQTPAQAPAAPAEAPVAKVETPATPPAAEAPKAEAQKPAEAPKVETPSETVLYQEYGHPAADAAVARLQELKVPADEAQAWFQKAAQSGNMDDIDFAAMEKRIGKNDATLVKAAVSDYYNTEKVKTSERVAAVERGLGGKENASKAIAWANEKAKTDPKFGDKYREYIGMIDLGSASAELAAKELLNLYNADPNNKTLGGKIMSGDGIANNQEQNAVKEVTDRRAFVDALKKAEANGDTAEAQRLRDGRRGYHRARGVKG